MIDYRNLQKWLKEECNKEFSLKEFVDIRVLDVSFCKLESLHEGLSLLPNLRYLECRGNFLKKIDLKSSSIRFISCTSNRIEELNLDTPALSQLVCSVNNLRELELNCPQLLSLVCDHNQITKIKLNCPLLTLFYCYGNNFIFKKNDPMIKIFKSFNLNCYKVYDESGVTELL